VTRAVSRLDYPRVRRVYLDLLAKSPSVNLEVRRKSRTITLPGGGCEYVVRDHAPHVLGKAREEAKLHGAEPQVPAGSADPSGIDIEHQVAHLDFDAAHAVSADACPDVGPKAGDQFRHAERFRDIVVRAGVQTGDDVGLVAKRGQDDDRYTRDVSYLPAKSQTALVAWAHVQDNRLNGSGTKHVESVCAVRRGDRGKPVGFERERQHLRVGLVVVNEQRERIHPFWPLARARPRLEPPLPAACINAIETGNGRKPEPAYELGCYSGPTPVCP